MEFASQSNRFHIQLPLGNSAVSAEKVRSRGELPAMPKWDAEAREQWAWGRWCESKNSRNRFVNDCKQHVSSFHSDKTIQTAACTLACFWDFCAFYGWMWFKLLTCVLPNGGRVFLLAGFVACIACCLLMPAAAYGASQSSVGISSWVTVGRCRSHAEQAKL